MDDGLSIMRKITLALAVSTSSLLSYVEEFNISSYLSVVVVVVAIVVSLTTSLFSLTDLLP